MLTAKERELRTAAQTAVAKAKAKGELTPRPCEVCGVTKVEAHHSDYSKPLSVRWLCRKHHKDIHRAPEGPFKSTPIRASITDAEWIRFRKLALDRNVSTSQLAGEAIRAALAGRAT